MRLELGRRADYAIRATLALASGYPSGELCKARTIAEEMAIPQSYIPQILAELVRAGIADSVAGRDGGYRLARDPGDVTLLEVVEAADGEVISTSCVLRSGPCRWEDLCAVHVPWARAQFALLDSLAEVTFADITAIDAALVDGTYRIPDDVLPARERARAG